jgi:alcohol dehydrogenase (NADP+)
MLTLPILTDLAVHGSLAMFGFGDGGQIAIGPDALTPSSPSSIPLLGFGTWNLKISERNTTTAVSAAIQAGYKHIDCAAIYGNEKEVGEGIKRGLETTGQRREDIWVTSKLWNDHHVSDKVADALQKTLGDLGLDYLDLYLMHWPVASAGGKNTIDYLETWHAMSAIPSFKARYVGVSNFDPKQLKDLIAKSSVKPAIHQFELHPYLQQTEWVQWHKDNGINVTAYSPLANLNPIYGGKATPPSLLENEDISKIAKSRGCTNAQVALAWGMGRKTSVIPKSSHVGRIKENLESTECNLEKEDYSTIKGIANKHTKRFNNPSDGWGVPLYEDLEGV